MNTQELSANLQALDQKAQSMGQSIQRYAGQAVGYRRQGYEYEQMAQSVMSSIYSSDGDDDYEQKSDQASHYMDEASRCYSMADQAESQADALRGELRGIRSEYEYYVKEGQTNLANLEIAVQSLTGAASGKYGRDKLSQALQSTRQRIVFNQNLVSGCQKRIAWIDQMCGTSGDQYTKVLRR